MESYLTLELTFLFLNQINSYSIKHDYQEKVLLPCYSINSMNYLYDTGPNIKSCLFKCSLYLHFTAMLNVHKRLWHDIRFSHASYKRIIRTIFRLGY